MPLPTCQLPTPHTLPHSRSCSGWSARHSHLSLLFSQKSLKRSGFLHGKLTLSTLFLGLLFLPTAHLLWEAFLNCPFSLQPIPSRHCQMAGPTVDPLCD